MEQATPEPDDSGDGTDEGGGRADAPDHSGGDRLVVVAVTVTRTGGFAGLRRTWRARPERDEAPQWIALIDECPWDAVGPHRTDPPSGADRFIWHVDARCGDAAHEAALADPEVQGPWLHLIDAVRAAAPADTGRGGARPR